MASSKVMSKWLDQKSCQKAMSYIGHVKLVKSKVVSKWLGCIKTARSKIILNG